MTIDSSHNNNFLLKQPQKGVASSNFFAKPGEAGAKSVGGDKDSTALGDALLEGNTTGSKPTNNSSAKDAYVPTEADCYGGMGLSISPNKDVMSDPSNSTALFMSNTKATLNSTAANAAKSYVPRSSSSGTSGPSGSSGASGGNALGVLQTVGGGLNSLGSLNNTLSSGDSTSPEMKELNELNSQLQKELATLKTIEGDISKLNTELGQMKEATTKATESRDSAKQAVGQAQNDLDTHMSNKPTPQKDENGNITNQQEIDAWEQKKTELENTLKQKQKELESAEQKLTEATKSQENKQKEYDTKSKEKETQSAKCQQLQTKRDAALAKVKQANSLNGDKKTEGADKSGSKTEAPKADAQGNIKADDIKDKNVKSQLESKYPGPRIAYTQSQYDSVAGQQNPLENITKSLSSPLGGSSGLGASNVFSGFKSAASSSSVTPASNAKKAEEDE